MKYLEVGVGHERRYTWRPTKFGQGDEYVTLDKAARTGGYINRPIPTSVEEALDSGNHSAVANIREMQAAAQAGGFTLQHIAGDASYMPDFDDNTFAEAVMANVLGDPAIHQLERQAILWECGRVSGVVTVVEEITPSYAYEIFDFEKLGFMKLGPVDRAFKRDTSLRVISAAEIWSCDTENW